MNTRILYILFLLFICLPAFAEGMKKTKEKIELSTKDETLSPYFLIKSDSPEEATMPLKETDVAVNIAGVIADVCVKQIYINESKNTLEAVYVFPGSTRAAVYGMTMVIGNKRITAQIKERGQARQEYEQAKEEGKSTTLLEQQRPNVFQMNVANILPGDTIVVEMNYTELLENLEAEYEFVYPTVVGPRYTETGEDWVERSTEMFKSGKTPQFSIRTIIQAGMPIQKIGSPSHGINIESPTSDQAIITLSNRKDYEGNRDYILRYQLQGGKVESGLLRYEHGDENFFLLMVQPPKKPALEQIPPREYVFIVDVSGSMHGKPLKISKKLIRNLVSSLRPTDRFNILLFESSSDMLYKESVPATKNNIKKALDVIDGQRGSGGTRLYPAIQKAMSFKETQGYSRTFVIATDGYVTVEKEAFNYVRSHLNEANLFPFGIGTSVNRYIIEGLAHAGMGTPYIITNFSEADEIGSKVIKEISQPVLTNISIDWGDFDVYDVEPVAIPDVFAERPILIYGKYKGAAKGTITISGLSGETDYSQEFNVAKARKDNNQALRYLWARNQIRYFDDYAQYYEGNINSWTDYYGNHARSPKQIEQVTKLGLKYNLLTQYTSFLAVDDVVRQPRHEEYDEEDNDTYQSETPAEQSTSTNPEWATEGLDLEEVVVVGYGTSRKYDMTGSHSIISSSQMGLSATGNILQGRIPGVQVSHTSGEPGDISKMRIRGISSITDNNSPLIILDGITIENSDFAQMNTANIDNITILKDASATVIYGARGANGVIIITSKKPSQQKRSILFSSTFSIELPNRLPDIQRRFAQGRPENGTGIWNPENEPFSWGPEVNSINAPTYDAYDILETGYTFKNHLNLSGRYGNYYYSFMLGNKNQHGFIPKSKLNDTSIGLKLGKEKSDKFNYDLDISYKKTEGTRLQRGYNMSGMLKSVLLTPPTFDNRTSTHADGSQRSAGNAVDNPYWITDNNPFGDETNRLTGGVNLNYKLIDYLTLQYQANGDYLSKTSNTALNIGSVYNATGHIMTRDEDFKSVLSRFLVKFDKEWNELNTSVTVGHEYSNSRRTIDRKDGYDLKQPGIYSFSNAENIIPFKQSFKRHSHSLFGKAGLTYKRTYIFETGMRGEWSSVNDPVLLSPSVGVGVNIHEMLRSGIIPYFKLFANISRADKETPLYLDPVYFNSAMYNLNDASNHFESREVSIDNVKPESIRHYEVGTNIKLWDYRIGLSTSLYWKKGKNQLLPTEFTSSMVKLENCGTFRTHGFEAELEANLVRTRDFNWTSNLIFTLERNKITSLGGRKLMLAGIEDAVGSYAIEGQPLGVLYGTAYKRDDQGKMIIGDDGFPMKSDELKVLGDPNPDWQMSWLNSFEYRNFTLSILLDYKKGGKMWNGTKSAMNYYGTSVHSATHRNTTNYIFPGVLTNGNVNNIPVNFYGNTLDENRWVRYGQYGIGEDSIEDASYLKLREISLGYYIPFRLFDRNTKLRLALFASNILLFSKYKGVDPETNLTGASNGFGLDYFNMPGVQSFGMSLKWEF